LSIPTHHRAYIHTLFEELLISATAFPDSQCPFYGALDVIRWFQEQPNTYVGLNTGRPESLRITTLNTLNSWGRLHDVVFWNELLYMCRSHDSERISSEKVAGIDYFRQCGYRTIAFFDNEPENLKAVCEADPGREILLLHADTIFKSDISRMPKRAVKGNIYDIRRLVAPRSFQTHKDDPNWIENDNDFRRTA
jgi:hypothetical protein